jgi:hypothetical protein
VSRQIRHWTACCILLTGSVTPVSALTLEEQLKSCATEVDAARRLDCYDRLAGRPAVAAGTAAPRPAPAITPPPATAPSAPAPGTAAAAPPAPAAAPAPASSNPAEFGISNGPLAVKRQSSSLKSISAVVAKVATQPRGELVITLDNGQVWQQLAAVDYFPLKTGDTVEISSGALGSYVLASPAKRYTKVTRIR